MDGGDGFGGGGIFGAVGWKLTEMAKFGAYAAFGSSLRLYVGTRSAFPLRLTLFLSPTINGYQSATFPPTCHVADYYSSDLHMGTSKNLVFSPHEDLANTCFYDVKKTNYNLRIKIFLQFVWIYFSFIPPLSTFLA